MGVRISWLMFARNALFAWFASSAAAVRSATRCSSVALSSRSSASTRERSAISVCSEA